jgi:hypothetical protein
MPLIDDQMEFLDRTGPVRAGLQDVADAPLEDLAFVRLVRARKPVERFQDVIANTESVLVAPHLGFHSLRLPQPCPQHAVEADADAGAVAVLDRHRLARRKGLLPDYRRLQSP